MRNHRGNNGEEFRIVRIEIVYHPVRLNQRRIHYGADREEIEDQMLKEIEENSF